VLVLIVTLHWLGVETPEGQRGWIGATSVRAEFRKTASGRGTDAERFASIFRQKLPILDGFVAAGAKPLEQYERGFYQFTIEVLPGEAGATVVRLSAKITAW
jgi:hypothetical protein